MNIYLKIENCLKMIYGFIKINEGDLPLEYFEFASPKRVKKVRQVLCVIVNEGKVVTLDSLKARA